MGGRLYWLLSRSVATPRPANRHLLTCSAVQLCYNARGGVFDIKESDTWEPLGPWQLNMNYTGYDGNGDYGLDSVAFVNTVTQFTTAIDQVLISAINTTDFYQGYIGVGVTQGMFADNVTNPFISQLAQTYGTIPSHSYGYTAGAYYRDSKALLTIF